MAQWYQTVNLQSRVRILHLTNLPKTCESLAGKVSRVDIEMAEEKKYEKIQKIIKKYKNSMGRGCLMKNRGRKSHDTVFLNM